MHEYANFSREDIEYLSALTWNAIVDYPDLQVGEEKSPWNLWHLWWGLYNAAMFWSNFSV